MKPVKNRKKIRSVRLHIEQMNETVRLLFGERKKISAIGIDGSYQP